MKPAAVITLCSALLFATSVMALEPEACQDALQDVDARIASGDYPQQKTAIARQIRDGIIQSCAFMDEAALAAMLQNLDQLLPLAAEPVVVSPAEKAAERQAQRDEADRRQAEREKQRAAAQQRLAAEQSLISPIVQKSPTANSAKSQLMARQDGMWGASIVDWDIYQDSARVLYRTRPSRQQGQQHNAKHHFYVVMMDANDNIVQHQVVVANPGSYMAAALVRGRDEIVLQWREGSTRDKQSVLERWSISAGNKLSSAPAPDIKGFPGMPGASPSFALATERGDLLFAATLPLESGPTAKTGVSWLLSSLQGKVRDQGVIISDDEERITLAGWFHAANGSAGLILTISSADEQGIESQLKPNSYQFGGTEIRPTVSSERRLYVVGEQQTGANLPAFERRIMWPGLEKVDQAFMLSGKSTQLMNDAEGHYRSNDSAVTLAVAGQNQVVVEASGEGHGLLIKNYHRNQQSPPSYGLWLQEFVPGKPPRDTYLNPEAKHLKAQFNMLADDGSGKLYVGSNTQVLLLDKNRQLSAYAETQAAKAVSIKAMIAKGNSLWLLGEQDGADMQRIWVERLQF